MKMSTIELIIEYIKEQISKIDTELEYLILDLDKGKIKEDNTILVRAFIRLSVFKSVLKEINLIEACSVFDADVMEKQDLKDFEKIFGE
jgi:hypothetical protein